jgi:outer membrane lipoprotein-sorting protein
MCNSLLPSLCRVLTPTLVFVVFTGIAADKESTDELTAQQILDKMAITYATCQSYRDSGVVTNDFGPHSAGEHFPRHIDVKPFRTAFVRPDQFRFEYDDATLERPYIVWAKGSEVRTWWYIKPGVEKSSSLDLGIAGATGVSSGSAHTIPMLLLPDRLTGAKLSAMTDLTRLPDESLDGTPCFKLQGKYGFGNQPRAVWFEKATFLLRRIAGQSGLNKSTTDYRPEVNKEIPAKELELGAPITR